MPHCLKSLKVQHCLTLFTSLLECLCFAGIVLGWASLAFVLKTKGYFSSLCVNTTVNATHVLDCKGQDEQFSLIFTIASFVFVFMMLPNGFLFDRFGTRVTRLFGISFFTMGTLMTAFSSTDLPYLLYPALSIMAGGGNIFILTSIQGGNLCKSYRGTLICIATGATGSSSVVFLVIKVLDEAGISLFASFLFLSACSVIHLLRTFFLLPKDRIPFPLPDDYTYGISCGKSKTLSLEQLAENDGAQMPTEEVKDVPVKPEKSSRECLKSRFFTLHVIWLSVMQLRHFFFTGTLNPTLQRLTAEDPSLDFPGSPVLAFTMTTARFVSGASLFALLIVDICCLPVQKGTNPGAYGSSNGNVAPNFDSYQGAPSGQSSHGAVLPNNAPPKAGSTLSHQAATQQGSSFLQPTVQRGPAPSVGSSSSSGPAFSGYRDSSLWNNPASSAQPGADFQPGSEGINWAVAPLSRVSGGAGLSGPSGVSSQTGYVSPPLPPPGPVYQGGDLSRFERNFEYGNTERETEEQGSLAPAFTSQPQPRFNFGWGRLPYPYDVTFLTGQYPPGTYSHASSSYEQGTDRWQDTHYIVDAVPYNSGPVLQKGSSDFGAPQSKKDPKAPVGAAHYGQGGTHAGLPASYGGFRQSGSQAGGFNPGQAAY